MTYLDAASSAPLHPVAAEALAAALADGWADPSRLYREGRRARLLLDGARAAVADCLGARPDELSFSGSGTAAVTLALRGTLAARARVGSHAVASAVEHSSVLHALEATDATLVAVDRAGVVDAGGFAAALRPDTAVASLQSANHETGTRQPVAAVAAATRTAGVPLHVDAAQSVGHEPIDMSALGADLLTASAHKWGGPPGVGVLVVRTGTRWRSPDAGDGREGGRVAGFENVPAILAAAASLQAAVAESAAEDARLRALVDRLRTQLPQLVPDVQIVGHPDERLPHIVTFSCLYVDGEPLLTDLDAAGFSVSSGSSCTSDTLEPSHVLVAMGVVTHGNIRLSLHRGTTADDIDRFLAALPPIVSRLRTLSGYEQ
ncbi:MAG: cysteine desulfurase [Frankiaceae bacterium]|jgi:cysteine desulfurase|nr:cysteine desulfurase [Frankiaceae bacterium]